MINVGSQFSFSCFRVGMNNTTHSIRKIIGITVSRWWWFQIFFFSPLFGEMIQFDSYFSDGLKPPTRYVDTALN